MFDFLQLIPSAAQSPYAYAAYVVSAVLFVLVGSKLRKVRIALREIRLVPESERRHTIEAITQSVIPETITADEWIRNNRNRYLYEIAAVVALLAAAIIVIALLRGRTGLDSAGSPPSSAEAAIEAQAFLQDLDSGKYSAAYERMQKQFRSTFPLDQWLSASAMYRAPLGAMQHRVASDSEAGEQPIGSRMFNVMVLSYLTKFANSKTPVAEMVTLASPGRPVAWKVMGYHVNAAPPPSVR